MRYTHDDVQRNFEVPFGSWLIPVIGSLLCTLLLVNTTKGAGIRFGIWLAICHIVYFSYGFWHSKARSGQRMESHDSDNELVPRGEPIGIGTNQRL